MLIDEPNVGEGKGILGQPFGGCESKDFGGL